MRKLLLALLLVVFGCSSAAVPEAKPPVAVVKEAEVEEKVKKIDWQPFSDDVLNASLAIGKPVFLYLKDDKCGHCKRMTQNTFSHPIVVDLINKKFIPAILDVRTNTKVARVFYRNSQYITVPKVVMLRHRADGKIMAAEVGGYVDVFELVEAVGTAERYFKSRLLNESEENEESPGEPESLPAE